MFLPSAHRVEPEVHCDDDRWSHLGSTRSQYGLQRQVLILPVETLPIQFECLHWDLRSLQGVTALEWVFQTGNLAITSITFAAVIWDASGPCSSETVKAPESSFTMSPRSTTLPLYFWNCGSKWHMPFRVVKWTFFWSLCASRIPSFFAVDFTKLHAGIVSSFFQSSCTEAFAFGLE